jgi:hypothetical protein
LARIANHDHQHVLGYKELTIVLRETWALHLLERFVKGAVIAMNACVSGEEFLDVLKPRNETGRTFKNLASNGGMPRCAAVGSLTNP